MADLHGFNAGEVDPQLPFDPLPAGKYVAVITESEVKPTKAGNGSYLELTFQVVEGEHKNRYLWARLNLENPTPKAVEIARAELSSICRAVDVLEPRDSAELHDRPLLITVRCRKREDTGDIVNEIRGYAKHEGAAKPQVQASNDTPPWA